MRLLISLFFSFGLLHSPVVAEMETLSGRTMGTTYTIKFFSEEQAVHEIPDLVENRLAEINRLMSTYDPESELSRFNQSTTTDWFSVSPDTAFVVKRALEIHQLSGGAFDPTVGRLVKLWSFGEGDRTYAPPPADPLREAKNSMGADLVKVRNDPPAIKKLRPTIHLDLSAIAKGYGVDAISELLREHGIQHSLVEIGGEVRAIGSKHGTPWTIGIERPEPLQSGIYAKVQLHNQSLATSGNYRNYFEKDGVRYSHTIDPQTGAPVTHSLASVSVVAESCMDADAWATALMVVGLDRGKSLAEQRGLSAYFITHAANGEYSDATTSSAQGLFASASNEQPVRPSSRWGTAFSTFLLALGVFAVATLGLAIGVILANRELKGTCGGASGLKDDEGRPICEMCSIPPDQCDRFREEASTSGVKK